MTTTNTTTIAAIATASGQGGVGIVRLSGKGSYAIGCAISKRQSLTPRYAHLVKLYDDKDEVLDEAVLIYFKAPHSFTGEDVVELQGHGGSVLLNLVLARCFELGARQATAGEFSFRAFDNGKLDLLQAEAISDAISATSAAEARSAIRSLSGEFSQKIHSLGEDLIHLRLYVEAMIDFSDEEDVDFLADGVLISRMDAALVQMNAILATARQGVLLKDGVTVVLAGRPNAGKSSLLNRLAGIERAIVTDVAGTTRDTLEETVLLGGLSVHLTDTAGLRETTDKVEKIGIERALTAIGAADVLLLVYDLASGDSPEQLCRELLGVEMASLGEKLIIVGNKADLTTQNTGKQDSPLKQVNVSCETGAGIETLINVLHETVGYQPNDNSVIARTRHIDALKRAKVHLEDAKEQLIVYQAGELSAESLRLSHKALGELTGDFSADDLLGRIFSTFCIGK